MAEEPVALADHRRHLARFYELLETLRKGLQGGRRLSECHGGLSWPKRGVYYFFELGEVRQEAADSPRVVRVGTHAVSAGSKTTLWDRLRSHRGSADGGGNHRGSIFRLHVGMALLNREKGAIAVPSWGVGQSCTKAIREQEASLEQIVSQHLGKLTLLWLSVCDEPGPASVRSFLERNSLGLLTQVDAVTAPPSASWLGRHSVHEVIRSSGLWNLNYVNGGYFPEFLDVMEECIAKTLVELQ